MTIIYRPPLLSSSAAISRLEAIISKVPSSAPYLIAGDFNEDVAHNTPISTFLGQRLTQLVTQPTTRYASLLDHIYTCNISCTDTHVTVRDMYFSDHDLAVYQFPINMMNGHAMRNHTEHYDLLYRCTLIIESLSKCVFPQ